MALPHTLIGGVKVAPFKTPSKEPYGAYANTTPSGAYPVKQTITVHRQRFDFTWPSSEHAYHAQKILHLKAKLPDNHPLQQALTQALKTVERHQGDHRTHEFLPRNHWDPIIANMIQANRMAFNNLLRDKNITPANTGDAQKDAVADFSILADANYHSLHAPGAGINPATREPWTKGFMRTVIELKLETNPKLKGLAMQMAREGIMPIEFSQYDDNWASGKNGNGANMLGIILLEIGNGLLINQGERPAIPNPNAHYEALKAAHGVELSHDRLIPKETHTPISWPSVTPSSESSIISSFKQFFFGQAAPQGLYRKKQDGLTYLQLHEKTNTAIRLDANGAFKDIIYRTPPEKEWHICYKYQQSDVQALLAQYVKETGHPMPTAPNTNSSSSSNASTTPSHSSIDMATCCFTNRERNQRITVDSEQVIKAERKENGQWSEIYKEQCQGDFYNYYDEKLSFDGHTLTGNKNLSP